MLIRELFIHTQYHPKEGMDVLWKFEMPLVSSARKMTICYKFLNWKIAIPLGVANITLIFKYLQTDFRNWVTLTFSLIGRDGKDENEYMVVCTPLGSKHGLKENSYTNLRNDGFNDL